LGAADDAGPDPSLCPRLRSGDSAIQVRGEPAIRLDASAAERQPRGAGHDHGAAPDRSGSNARAPAADPDAGPRPHARGADVE
jgi:hypothetical protein